MGCCGDDPNKVGVEESPDSGKFGTPKTFDPNFRGPISNRSCTDIICCLLFLIFLLGQGVVSYFAYYYGNPAMLIHPTDSDGNLCGQGSKEGKPYLFYFDLSECARLGPAAILSKGCPTPTVCLAKCPTDNWAFATTAATEAASSSRNIAERSKMICENGVNASITPYLSKNIETLVKDKTCAPYRLESKAVINRCVPKILFDAIDLGKQLATSAGDAIASADNSSITGQFLKDGAVIFKVASIAQQVLNDVIASWWLLLVALGIAMITSFIWIVLLRLLAGCMVWCTLILFQVVFLGASGYCFYRYHFMASKSFQSDSFQFQLTGGALASYFTDYKETWLAFGIVAAFFALIIFFIIICLRKRLKLAIALVGEASKAVASIATSLIYPIFPFIFELAVVGYWGATTVFLASVSKPTYTPSSNGSVSDCGNDIANVKTYECNFFKYTGENWSIYLIVYTLFVSLWLLNFVIALGQITLAGAFASWYWAWEKPKDVPTFPIAASLGRSLRYHMGSLAFGALIIAIIQLIRIFLEYIDRKVKGSGNPVAKFVICCLKCFFWCLEKFMKFINKNAYIVIAIYGKNFCASAKDAFFLLMRNIVRVVVVDRVTAFVLFVGQLMVVGGVTTLAFFFFNGQIVIMKDYTPTLTYFYVPVILVAIGSFFVARLFFSVFDFAVDTLFLCAMEDLERHDGSPEKPYFMSTNLMRVLDKENKFNDKDRKEGCGVCCC